MMRTACSVGTSKALIIQSISVRLATAVTHASCFFLFCFFLMKNETVQSYYNKSNKVTTPTEHVQQIKHVQLAA